MNTKWLHPMNLFSLLMILLIISIGIGLLVTNYYQAVISGKNRVILGVVFLIYASIRSIRFYQIINAAEDEEIL